MSKWLGLGLSVAVLALGATAPAYAAGELITLVENGPRANRVNVVVVAEGYLSNQKSLFEADLLTFRDALESDPVLAAYGSYHNIYGAFFASNQSGADADNISTDAGCAGTKTQKDTYFDASYCYDFGGGVWIQRLLTVDGNLAQQEAAALVPEVDIVTVLVNSSVYGGSGGSIAVANRLNPEIVAHEIGHSFVGLKDEYEGTDGYTPSEGINATARTTRSQIVWRNWIDAGTPVPTPFTSPYTDGQGQQAITGLFEGANYMSSGWYRPQYYCRMRSNGVDLCKVCGEAWLLAIYQLASPIDSWLPDNSTTADIDGPGQLQLTLQTPNPENLLVRWFIDGFEETSETGASLEMLPPVGSHRVVARVADQTAFVRNDTQGLMMDSVVWNVNALPASLVEPRDPATPMLSANLRLLSADAEGLTLWLALPSAAEDLQLDLIFTDGRLLARNNPRNLVEGSQRISFGGNRLPPGSYLLRARDARAESRLAFRVDR